MRFLAEQSSHIYNSICTNLNYLESGIGENFIQKLEIIDLSATNWTFVTKYEFESNFLTTPTEKSKLNHWVNTQLNQLVIQFEPIKGVLKKFLLNSYFY